MNFDMMNKIVRLSNGESYVMLDSTNYNGTEYYLANDVDDNHLGNDIAIFKVALINDKPNLVLEENVEVCQELIKIFSAKAEQ